MDTFEDLKLSDTVAKAIKGMGFTKPTIIQEKSINHIVNGKDVIGESATGSGKTLAFGTGILEHVVQGKGLQALVLTPTRELADQVKDVIKQMCFIKKLKVIVIYGGVAMNPQIDALETADVVIATPGRLLDHHRSRTIDLSRIKVLVLDEADRMFDMGFIDDVEKIIHSCPKKRQTLFFSATILQSVRDLASKHMCDPIMIAGTRMVDPKKLEQVYYNVPRNLKLSLLIHLLKKEERDLVMVFCNTRRITDVVVANLKANDVKAIAIHGGLAQNKRSKTMEMFNNAKFKVLVCTDVAARGLDIDEVSHIYNYDLPMDPTDYVHRIGRTARAGEKGKVINLLSDVDHGSFARILEEHRYEIKVEKRPYLEMLNTIKAPSESRNGQRSGGYRGGQRRGPPRRGYSRNS